MLKIVCTMHIYLARSVRHAHDAFSLCGKFSGKAAGCLKGALEKSVYAAPNSLIMEIPSPARPEIL